MSTFPVPHGNKSQDLPFGKENENKMASGFNSGFTRWLSYGLTFCLLIALMTGCNSNNPSGPTGTPVTTASGTTTTGGTATPTTGAIVGSLVESDTNQPINDAAASITVYLYLGDTLRGQVKAANNSAFSFSGFTAGFYTLKIEDANAVFRTNFLVVEIVGGSTTQTTIRLTRNPDPSRETVNLFGRVVDSVQGAPIMFSTVTFAAQGSASGAASFNTSSLGNGSFFIDKVASGTWTMSFSKTNYETQTFDVIVQGASAGIVFRNKLTTTTTTSPLRGDGTTVTGFDLGDIQLKPSFVSTGGIEGQLRATTAPFNFLATPTALNLFYKRDAAAPTTVSYILRGFKCNAQGYIQLENLPPGFYAIADADTMPVPILDVNGAIVGWNIVDGGTDPAVAGAVYAGFLEVKAGSTTPLPSSGLN